jgi:predicted DNA-binding transcriptional regulator AlpA
VWTYRRPEAPIARSRSWAARGVGQIRSQSAVEPPRWANDRLIGITEIRSIFNLGRTAAYQLTHRPGFPDPVTISPRCYRWWAREVAAFTATLRRESAQASAQRTTQRTTEPHLPDPATTPRRITGKVRATRIRREAS